MINIPNYQITQQIYESANSLVYRALRNKDNQAVILKVLKEDYPTPEELTRYRQEYDITRRLADLDGVVKAYSLEKHQNTLVICLENFGAKSLKMWLEEGRRFNLDELLTLAIHATEILGQIHRQNITHKDINPANLVFNPTTGVLKIIDFGISTQFSKQHLTLKNPDVLEGTLAYMSPEQTGRMNRALDYHSDFYSLGVTFYELFTGKLPFESKDAMELVHCHIAKQPVPPNQINPELPIAISNIIIKLLEKTAEARYQSAYGIKADLEKLQENLPGLQDLAGLDFELAQHDISDRFQIPQELYGRESEIDTLRSTFERVASGKAEIMLVAGYSGIGKSVLVKEIYKSLTEKQGYFISGKFDQFQCNIPYSAVINAFKELAQQLLTETEAQLAQWKKKLLTALGPNGQVIINVLPEIELIIGKQPSVPQLGPSESQNRFNLVFQNFMRVFCQPEHPLVIFLDDLQWVDSATLKLLELVTTDRDNTALFLIGAYRDNEVDQTHPLIMTLNNLRSVTINQITLKPLAFEHINQLITESLRQNAVGSLTDLVIRKTGGNPFFVNQFLHTLYEEELLTFQTSEVSKTSDVLAFGWKWDINQIETLNITDNVVDLMIGKLKKLPESAQHVLRLAACVGNRFDLDTLSVIYEKSVIDTFADLMPVLIDGLILPLSELEMTGNEIHNSHFIIHHLQYLHDRVQQAAYALIDNEQKQVVHLQIGRLLFQEINKNSLQERLFEITDHFNVASEFLKDDHEKIKVAGLNLIAGDKAISAMAGSAAVQYFQIGLSLLPKNSWEEHYSLALNLTCGLIESSFLTTSYQKAEKLCNVALHQAQSALDKARIYSLMCYNFTLENKMEKTLTTGLEALKILNIPLVENPPEIINFEQMRDLPEMKNPDRLAAMSILVSIISCALVTQSPLMMPLIYTMVNLSAKHGNCSKAPFGYVWYGCALCWSRTDIGLGYRFGRLAIDVMEKFKPCEVETTVLHQFNSFIRHWCEHERFSINEFPHIVQVGKETGDIEYGTYVAVNYVANLLLVGEPLASTQEKQRPYLDWVASTRFSFSLTYANIWAQTTQCLMNQGDSCSILQGDFMDENKMIPEMQKTKNNLNLFAIYAAKAMLSYFNARFHESAAFAKETEQYEAAIGGLLPVTQPPFYGALALLKITSENAIVEQDGNKILETYEEKWRLWSEQGHKNFQHKYDLIKAEKARVFGQNWEAAALYEKSIAGAKENEYLHEEALAYELAAEFYLGRGMEKIAQTYMKDAHYRYQQWGALAKVDDLETRYPQWLIQKTPSPRITTNSTILATRMASISTTGSSEWLDLSSVTKASQTLAGEIVLSRLLEKMMHLVIENAGAEKGFLLLPKNDSWFIEAQGLMDDEVVVLQSLDIETSELVPKKIIHYVARTQENVILHNATQDGNFTQFPYIVKNRPKSVLCAPLVNQGQLTGILYLENNLTTGAFTPKRLEVLNLLSSQIAISIENSLLYNNLERKVAERTQELSDTLEHLKTTQAQLVESEKMASLGGLVAGIAHEINTPIGIGVTAASTLADRTIDTATAYANKQLKASALKAYFNMAQTSSNLVLNNLNRAAELIQSFKQVAVDQSNLDKRSFAVKKYIQDTLISLKPHLKKTLHQITVHGDEQIKINSYPGAFSQILTNLVMNSLRHAYPSEKAGNLRFEVKLNSEHLIIEYSDDGYGIPQGNLEKIFEPFFTTARNQGGTGLGLHIVFNLVTQKLNGTINVQSEIGLGTMFILNLPL